jgi:acyl-coenzyme A thioesterase PaaI-like protein
VGQVVLFSFTGSTAVPTTVVFGGVKVTAANTVVVRACNVGASAMTVSGLGIRVATFG